MDSVWVKSPQTMAEFRFDDSAVRLFLFATVFWGLVAAVLTAGTSLLLVLPQLAHGVPGIAFGRIAPIHTNIAIVGFAANALFASIYYSTQRLCWRPMWNAMLGYLHFWGWQFINVWILATLPFGLSQPREMAELAWPVDVAIALVWLAFSVNFLMTVFRRRQPRMYISLWFYLTSVIAFLPIHVLSNLVVPSSGYASTGLYSGIFDGFMQSWGGQSVLMYLLVMPFLGVMYYFFPKVTGRPVVNYRLAIIQFWLMTLLGTLAGSRFLHLTSIPEWSSSLGMLAGIAMFLPSWVGVMNGWAMLRRPGKNLLGVLVNADPVVRCFLLAILVYGFVSLESGFSSIKSIGAGTIFTDWTLAHTYAITFGWAGLLAFGVSEWIALKLFHAAPANHQQNRLPSTIFAVGVLTLIGSTYLSGYVQGSMSAAIDSTGTLVHPEFVEIVQWATPWWWVRFFGACVTALGFASLAWNLVSLWSRRDRQYVEPVQSGLALPREYEEEPQPPSRLEGAAVLQFGVKLDVWSRLAWHQRWERSAMQFTLLILLVISISIGLQVGPMWSWGNQLPEGPQPVAYTPLELAGREMFVREGCVSCHTQTVRPLVAETKRYGEFSQPADFYYDRPTQWGSRRIGPDLAREGGKQNGYWHWQHLENPQAVNPGSVMPDFVHLLDDALDVDAIRSLVVDAAASGVPYADEILAEDELTAEDRSAGEVTPLEAVVQRQAEEVAADIVKAGGPAALYDRQATALIAYLQRLGVPPTPAKVAATEVE